MSWYKIAQQVQQQDNSQSILSTGTPGTSSNPAGILVDQNDLRKLQSFNENSGPITVVDRDNGQNINVSIIHGGTDNSGKFYFSDGQGSVIYPNNQDDPTYQANPNDPKFATPWENRLGIGQGDKIIACHEGLAQAGQFDRVTSYQGKLQISVPVQIDPNQQLYRINVQGM
jgi:hypothetical protein